MDAGGYDTKDYPMLTQRYRCAVVGTGATPPVRATTGLVPPLFPVKANVLSTVAAEAPTRSGAGIYTLTVAARYKLVGWLEVVCSCYGTAGLFGQVSAFSPATRIITVRTFIAGVATDLTAADLLVVRFDGVDSSTIS